MIERIQELEQRLEEVADPRAQAIADDLVTAVVQTYGEALERILGARPGSLTFVDEGVLREWFGRAD